jgi:ribosomal protein S25
MNDNENNLQEKDLLNDERISRFLQGKMKADEEATFMDEMKNNENLRNQAIAQARLVKGMKQVDEELKDTFRLVDEQTIQRIAKDVSETSVSKKSSARWLAIAASVVFIVFVGFKSYDYYDTTSLGKKFANTFPTSTIIRGEANADVDTELTTLFNNVAEGKDLDNTTSRLKTLWELSKQDTYNDYTDYAPYIGWNLAIGYLRNYEKTMAKNVLKEMKQMYPEGTVIGDKITTLLGML